MDPDPVDVYFMVFSNSTEETKYINSLSKEKKAFEKLVNASKISITYYYMKLKIIIYLFTFCFSFSLDINKIEYGYFSSRLFGRKGDSICDTCDR